MTTPPWLAAGQPHVWRPYTQMRTAPPALPVVRTQGSTLFLADGRALVDGVGSWWTACHGYNHPHIAQAVHAQLDRMPHVMFGGLAHEPGYTLAARLAALQPDLPHVFFSESGSVAVEVALKMAAQYWLNQGVRGRTRFLAFSGGYHGDTLAAMSVCDPAEGMHARLQGLFPAQCVVPLPDRPSTIAAFEQTLARQAGTLAAVILEPLVQGAGGMLFHGAEVLGRVRAACDQYRLPLIADEVFTGFGRTGAMFASTAAAVRPDIMTLSKALTGGTMALAATLAAPHIYAAFATGRPADALMHGPTYMANPLACAAANAGLDLFERHDRLGQAAAIAERLRAGLAPCAVLPGVREVRVLGAIGVVELDRPIDVARLQARALAAGVWLRPFGNVIALTPALTITPGELDLLTGTIAALLAAPA